MRTICSAVALAACLTASLALPAVTRAQFSPAPAYTFNGCDYAYAEVFGPGPRLCASGAVRIGPNYDVPPGQLFSIADLGITASTGWSEGTSSYQSLLFVTDRGTYDTDSDVVGGCQYATVCRGFIAQNFLLTNGRIPLGATLQRVVLRVQYYPDSARTGSTYLAGNQYASNIVFTLTPVPEPSTVALTLGGLAVLGAGARRKRRA